MNLPRVIKLSTDDVTPYNMGEYNSYGSKWINYGLQNDYPLYLRKLYLSSPTHQAICDNTVNMATGEGVEVIDPSMNPISNKWLNENFSKDVVKHLLSDLKIYGYCAIQIYSGNIVKYSEAIKYRYDHKDEEGNINYVWYSNDWDNYTQRQNRPVKLPIYREGCDEEIQVLIVQLDKRGFEYYSPVDYNGGLNYINLEVEISKYHLSNIQNGLFPGFVITFIGSEFSDEQMNKIEMDINKKFGGSTNTGRAIIGFAPSKDDATVLETIEQPNISEQYQFLSKECSEKILCGHGVTSPLLFGLRDTGGGLGSNTDEMKTAYYLYFESKIKHYQTYILEMITKVMNGNLLYAPIQFINYNPFINNETKLSSFTFTNNETKLSSFKLSNEIDSQEILSQIDLIAVKPEGKIISEKIFNGKCIEGCVYKFVKSSMKNNLITKKFEMMTKKGYVFLPSDLIKNTSDYYFIEQIYYKKELN
jgi:hypothetical protein